MNATKIKNKKKLLFSGLIVASSTIIITPILTSCSFNQKLVFANFSGYMNPEVQEKINENYNVQWDEYESNENISTFLRNGTYDLSVATQYKIVEFARSSYKNIFLNDKSQEALINPIEWEKFGLVDEHNKPLVKKNNNSLYNFDNLKKYFTNQTWNMLIAYDIDGNNEIDESKDNLLNWTIPYFAQTLSFAYRGQKIDELSNKNRNITFKKIFDYFTTEDAKQKLFYGNKTISLIKDERTDFDLSRLLVNKSLFINPDFKTVSTIKNLTNEFSPLIEAINNISTPLNLEGDSNVILNQLARNEISGAITYNGDLIYAANGGDYSDSNVNEQNFHVITPKDTLLCFDGVVFSRKTSKNLVDNSYEIIKKIFFPISEKDNKFLSTEQINNLFSNDEYITYLPLLNFNYVFYVPVWSNLINAIKNDKSGLIKEWQKSFFNDEIVPIKEAQNNKLYKNLEYPTNQIVNSNLKIANLEFLKNVK